VIRFAYGLMVLLIVCAAGPLRADEAANTAAAKRLFASGTKHFDLNEFELALADFKEGYRLKDDPVFLYNIAQCHRLLNHDVEAMRFYKSYLRRSPNAPNKREVENKIRALDEAIASQEKARTTPSHGVLTPGETPPASVEPPVTAPPAASAPPAATAPAATVVVAPAPQPTPVYKKWWLWTTLGVVVAVGVGVGLGVGLTQSGGTTHGPFPTVTF